MMKWSVTTMIAVAVVLGAAPVLAEEAGAAVTVEVTGRNINLVKALCGEQAPETDATFGALNVLKVKEIVDADGNAVEGLTGKVLHYLPVAAASSLISGEANVGKEVVVKGVLYKDALVLSVTEFETKMAAESGDGGDDWDDWDDWDELGVTTMSQQQVI